jgi:predicted NAD/FAD-dependent oxidoreductase
MSNTETLECVVIGAGISGLLAARRVQEAGFRVEVLDKGRQVGGRMATRRIGDAVFDHGAQFFTCRSPEFAAIVREWLEADVARQWCLGFAGAANGHPRYRGHPGMTAGPKQLAKSLPVRIGFRVASVHAGQRAWEIVGEHGSRLTSRVLVQAAPVPQAMTLLDAGAVELPTGVRAQLESIRYDPCIAALALLAAPSSVPAPGAIQLDRSILTWVGDNARKGISSRPGLTLHASPEFSRDNWNRDDREVAAKMLEAARAWANVPLQEVQLHRWRYAIPNPGIGERLAATEHPLPIAFCGDAFGGARVEGAALSGIAGGDWAVAILSRGKMGASRREKGKKGTGPLSG